MLVPRSVTYRLVAQAVMSAPIAYRLRAGTLTAAKESSGLPPAADTVGSGGRSGSQALGTEFWSPAAAPRSVDLSVVACADLGAAAADDCARCFVYEGKTGHRGRECADAAGRRERKSTARWWKCCPATLRASGQAGKNLPYDGLQRSG